MTFRLASLIRVATSFPGQPVQLGVEPSNCMITKLKIDKSRKNILERRNRSADGALAFLFPPPPPPLPTPAANARGLYPPLCFR